MLEICLLGTGGTMPMPERALTALMVRYGGSNLLIDCGEGTQMQIRKMKWSIKSIGHILITHLHGDHIIGLPGLVLSMGKDGRRSPLEIYGPAGTGQVVKGLLLAAPELPFEVRITELKEAEEAFFCGGLRVQAFAADHGVKCYGYALHADRARRFDIGKARALNIPQALWSRLQKGETVEPFTPDMVLGESREGLHVTYVTDSRPTPLLQKYAENADLLICEGMYGSREKLDKALLNQHMLFTEAAQIAKEANAKQLWLTHYSPSLEDPREFLPAAQAIFPETAAPEDLTYVTLNWKNE